MLPMTSAPPISNASGHPLRVISHRCLEFSAPANSKAALRHALASSVDEVELDFRLTVDGSFVAAHLPWYRTPDGRFRRVITTTASMAHEHGLLTLSEALESVTDHVSSKRLRLEIKSRGAEDVLLDVVRAHGLSERVTFISWHIDSLQRLRRLDPTIRLGYSFLMGCQGAGRAPLALPRAIPAVLKDREMLLHSVNIVPSCFAPTPKFVTDLRSYGAEVILVTSYGLWSRSRVDMLGVDGVLTSDPGSYR